jgi:hypothetical protein
MASQEAPLANPEPQANHVASVALVDSSVEPATTLGDGGVCCVDEVDKMTPADQVAIREAMAQQTAAVQQAQGDAENDRLARLREAVAAQERVVARMRSAKVHREELLEDVRAARAAAKPRDNTTEKVLAEEEAEAYEDDFETPSVHTTTTSTSSSSDGDVRDAEFVMPNTEVGAAAVNAVVGMVMEGGRCVVVAGTRRAMEAVVADLVGPVQAEVAQTGHAAAVVRVWTVLVGNKPALHIEFALH